MGAGADIGRVLKQRKREDRQRRHGMNYARMMEWLRTDHDPIRLQRKNRDSHWIILGYGNRFDFWPSTGRLHVNGKDQGCWTFKSLISRLEKLRR